MKYASVHDICVTERNDIPISRAIQNEEEGGYMYVYK
jgi:hypothetical protein